MTTTYAEKGKTNVQITTETRDRLIALGGKGETYEDVIKRLLDRLCGSEDELVYEPFRGGDSISR